jgi:hypothetical protein
MANRLILCLGVILFASTIDAGVLDRELLINIETPVKRTTMSNISGIRGWTTHPTEKVDVVEMYIDGEFIFQVPVGGQRTDVYNAYPYYVDSRYSGYGQTVNFKTLSNGFHTVEVKAYTVEGNYNSAFSEFCVSEFTGEFIGDREEIRLTAVERIHIWNDRLILEGIEVEDRQWNVELSWNTATQGFEISQTTEYIMIDEYTEYNCDE